jgi:acetyltransferase-like isoleucine patch superfamily enzyme
VGDSDSDQVDVELAQWWHRSQERMKASFERHMPSGDLIVDRWERARAFGFGDGSSIYDSSLVIGQVSVGRNTWIGPGTILDGSGALVIGDHCSISAGVQVYTHESIAQALSGGTANVNRKSTRIGNRTYIGPNTVIEAGADIGDECVIGAMSLVRGTVPSGTKAYGVPARVLGPTRAEDWL